MQKDIKFSELAGKHGEEKEVTQVLEWAKLIHKLNEKCTAIQKEKQCMNKMSRAQYVAPGLKGNSPSELVTSWMRAFLSGSLYQLAAHVILFVKDKFLNNMFDAFFVIGECHIIRNFL
jgi:hypothetical protein